MPVDLPNERVHTTWSSMCAEHTAGPVIHIQVIQFQHLSIILKSFINYTNSGQYLYICDRDSSVGIATPYGLERPGFESRWRQVFPYPTRPVLGPTQPLYNGHRVSFNIPPPSSREVEERVQLHLYSPSGPSWQLTGSTVPLLLFVNLALIIFHIPKRYVVVVQP